MSIISKTNCFSISEAQNIQILTKFTFTPNYNYKKCLDLIYKAFEQTKNCQYIDCSLWKFDLNQKFPKMFNNKLNVI